MRLSVCLLALFLLPPAAAHAAPTFADDEIRTLCEGMMPRDVISVNLNATPISYKYNQSADDMTRVMRSFNPAQNRVGGMTSYQSDYTLRLYPSFAPAPVDGKTCYRIAADLDLARSPVVVSIAREYTTQKCSHDVILEHELKHVQAYRSFMRYFSKEFRRQFGEELNKVRLTTQTAGVEEEINRVLAPVMNKYIETALQRIQTINAEIDSPEENERVRNACSRLSLD